MPILPNRDFLLWRKLPALFLSSIVVTSFAPQAASAEIESQSFYVNYSASVPSDPLQVHPLAIVHPDAQIDLERAHTSETTVLAYLSVGEIAADAPYRAQAQMAGLRTTGINPVWKSAYLDLTDSRWADLIVDQLAAEAVAKGFDGFFLDTLDSVQLAAPNDAIKTNEITNALVALIKRLHRTYPEKKIVVNRGLFAFGQLSSDIDGVLVESLYSTWDFDAKINKPVAPQETAALLSALEKVTAAQLEVYVIDYAAPNDITGADHTADQIRSHGFHAFVTTPELNGKMLAPVRQVPRRICSFFGNQSLIPADQVEWPADSFTGKVLQTPLEWLGYEVDYFRIRTPQDFPALGDDYRAIILSRNWDIPAAIEGAFLDWLIAQKNSGKKILIFGQLPFSNYEQQQRFFKAFGIRGDASAVDAATSVSFIETEDDLLSYETKISPIAPQHLNLQASVGSQIILGAETQDHAGATIRFDAIFTCDWGGLSLDPYTLFMRADFVEFWNIDPFAFITRALGESDFPVPDTTTRDGKRMFMSHIDGDGFANGNWVEPGRHSAEVVRDRILKKYPLPVTVSIIEAEIRGAVVGQDPADVPQFESIARDIFKLPHVEAASHSYSHPFYWINDDPTKSNYDSQYLPLNTPYPGIDYVREIDDSVRYINEHLSHPDNPVQVFLWSGNCRPPPEALARVRELGIVNVNGGDTLITKRMPTVTAVAPRTMPWNDELQIFAPNQNENVYTNNWQGPLFGTFIHVIDTFKRTESPRRLKPVNVYYHFYSADFPASLRALERIHDWVMTQSLHSVTLSQYARLARDARHTRIFRTGHESWAILNQGHSRTLRLPANLAARISMQDSQGITGWNHRDGITYLHTNGSPVITISLAQEPIQIQARLVSSTAEINFTELTNQQITFTCEDLREIEVMFAGLTPRSQYEIISSGEVSITTVTEEGQLDLRLPAKAEVRLRELVP